MTRPEINILHKIKKKREKLGIIPRSCNFMPGFKQTNYEVIDGEVYVVDASGNTKIYNYNP